METKNEAATQKIAKQEKPKTIEQQLNEKAERERKEAIAKNKELEEQRKLEEKKAQQERERELRQKKDMEKLRYQAVFEKHLKEFEPKQIGEPNYKDSNRINHLYIRVCSLANLMRTELMDYLRLETVSDELIFEFIKNDPDKWLRKQYIEQTGKQIPENMDIEKVIELKLVHTPETKTLVILHKDFMNTLGEIRSVGFIYPLSKLYDEETGKFDTNFDFHDEIDEFLAVKTTTAEQNVIITILENLLESLYDLSYLRIIKLEKGPAELQRLESFLDYKAGAFTIKQNIFKHPALKQYFERPARNGQSTTLNQLLQ